jgi:hypothetical protein
MTEQDKMADVNKGKNDQTAQGGSPEEVIAAIDARFKKMEDVLSKLSTQQIANDRTLVGAIAAIVSSGFFFLVLGGVLIYLAQHYMSTNHAGITFVLVVLGVALVLYGTGTQGMGQFNTGGGAGYSGAIAGGAGIVAFAVAYGMIGYSTEMRNAFQPERKFVRVLVEGGDGVGNIAQYASSFEMDGVAVPAAKKGTNDVEVYVPYLPFEITKTATPAPEQQSPSVARDKWVCGNPENLEAARKLDPRATPKLISVNLYRVEPGYSTDTLPAQVKGDFQVRLDEHIFRSADGGIDYPKYPVKICINLAPVAREKEISANAQRSEVSRQPPGTLKPNVPPALVVTE